jgi:hypothetical protein
MSSVASDPAPLLPPHVLVSAYEALRQRVLGGPQAAAGVGGLVLFLQKGLAAWIKAASPVVSPHRSRSGAEPSALPHGLHGELTRLLATMALGTASTEVPT